MENDKFEGDYRWPDEESTPKIPKRSETVGRENIIVNSQYQIIADTQTLREKRVEKISNGLENSEYKGYSKQEKQENSEYKGYSKQEKQEKLEDREINDKTDNEDQNSEDSEKLEKEEIKKSEKEEPVITKSDIKNVIKLLQQIASGVIELQGINPYTYDDRGRDTTRRGRAHVYKYLNYYDVTNTIKKAGPIDPQDFDSPVYNAERVYEVLERYSDIIHVINGGTEPLFVVVSHEGRTNFSKESVIFPGEVKDFYQVYELRLRSSEVGLQYRVTEYLIMSVSQTSLIPIELASLHDVSLPDAGENWLETDITPLISPTTFRIEVAVSKTGIFSATITNHENIQLVNFNVTSGPELIEDGVYVFELLVHKGDSINFRFSASGGKIKILRVQEIDASTA